MIELSTIPTVESYNTEWDWSVCAEIVAKSRLAREGSPAPTVDSLDAVGAIYATLHSDASEDELYEILERVNLANTAKAARFIYTSGSTGGLTFMQKNIINNEASFAESLGQGKATIMLLTSISEPSNLEKARYVVICGIDTINHKYKIIDPAASDMSPSWYDISMFENGGALGNNDLIFTGMVIERG